MSQRSEILIGSQGGDHVSIKASPRSFEGWRNAEIEVHCDCWIGRMSGSFMKGELGRFAEGIRALYRNLAGTADLQPLEPNLILTLSGDGKGHVAVEGEATNHFERGTTLRFRFDIDQTFLPRIAEALSDADPAS